MNLVFALALIMSPERPEEPEQYAYLKPQCAAVGMAFELLDKRELPYIFSRQAEFNADLNLMQGRWILLKDAPRDAEGMRFPDRKMTEKMVSFNREYRYYLLGQKEYAGWRTFEIDEAITETNELYEVWDTIRDATGEWYYINTRRTALKKLRETLGEDAWHSGELPPCVPYWLFSRMK